MDSAIAIRAMPRQGSGELESMIRKKQRRMRQLVAAFRKISKSDDKQGTVKIIKEIGRAQLDLTELITEIILNADEKPDAVKFRQKLSEVNVEIERVNYKIRHFQQSKQRKIPHLPQWAQDFEKSQQKSVQKETENKEDSTESSILDDIVNDLRNRLFVMNVASKTDLNESEGLLEGARPRDAQRAVEEVSTNQETKTKTGNGNEIEVDQPPGFVFEGRGIFEYFNIFGSDFSQTKADPDVEIGGKDEADAENAKIDSENPQKSGIEKYFPFRVFSKEVEMLKSETNVNLIEKNKKAPLSTAEKHQEEPEESSSVAITYLLSDKKNLERWDE